MGEGDNVEVATQRYSLPVFLQHFIPYPTLIDPQYDQHAYNLVVIIAVN